jgi:type VI secretion system protein ImpK
MSGYSHDDAFDFLSGGRGGSDMQPARRQPPSPGVHEEVERIDIDRRLADVRQAPNALLEAASSLLRFLADMPASLETTEAVESLRILLEQEVGLFQQLCEKANLPWKHMAVVRYCLCTALDEAASRTRWGAGGVWASRCLLVKFEGEREGGEKFFLLIGRMATDPQEYVDILEIIYRALSLGFEGRYSVVTDGHRHLEQIRQRLWTLITGARDSIHSDLSSNWRGAQPGKLPLLRAVPAWASAAMVALILGGLYVSYEYRLLAQRNALERQIRAIGNEAPAQPQAAPQRLRLSVLLANEIARGLVTVAEDDRHSVVTFKGDAMFESGQSRVLPDMDPVLEKVAHEIARVGGDVSVVGYTDNQPIRTAEFPSNLVLSGKRAAYVAGILEQYGTPADRIRWQGKGDAQPLADNATAAGRSRNRRVEITVTL